jgi:medium-chain acyl-[acyl-carrier-protein] hydrolase
MAYRGWADWLPASLEVCSIQLPGRATRFDEPLVTRLDFLIQGVASAMLPHLDRPFMLFGHSMGALLSFEVARFLRRSHDRLPAHLFVSARRAPQLPGNGPIMYNLPDAELREELRRLQGFPEEIYQLPATMDMIIPILRADFEACETYVYSPEPPLACSITALGGLRDRRVGADALRGWGEQTCREFDLRMFPGDHFFLRSSRMLLLRTLTLAITSVESRLVESASPG